MSRREAVRAAIASLLPRERRARRRRMAVVAAVLGFLLWAFVGGSDGFYAQWRMSRRIDDLRRSNNRLELTNELMRLQIQRLTDDMDYIERIARERYGMARPDERVYRVLPTVDAAARAGENQ